MFKSLIKINKDNGILNTLIKKGVKCFDIKKDEDAISFKIEHKNVEKVQRLLKNKKVEYYIDVKKKPRFEIVQIILTLFMYGALFVFNSINLKYIDKIEIISSNPALTYDVKDYVNNLISFPKRYEDIDKKDIEYKIVSKYDSIAFCQVYRESNTLYIELNDVKVDNNKIKDAKKVVSNFDAIITKVLLQDGMSVVKEGDLVKKGSLLIDGRIPSKDSEDEYISTKARGEVYGIVMYERHLLIPKSKIENIRGDLIKKQIDIKIGQINLSFNKNIEHDVYQICTKNKLFCLLPIEVIKKEIYSKKMHTYTLNNEDIEEIILNEKELLLNKMPIKYNLNREWVDKKEIDNIVYLDIYYEIEQCISIEED